MSATELQPLTDEQRAAVASNASAIVVIASAGSGKTEVVARRVERLLEGSPEADFRVLAVSYTVKAADELDQRFGLRLGNLRRRVDTNTLHGFAHALLRQHGTRIGLPVEPEVLSRDEDRAELLVRWLEAEDKQIAGEPTAILRELDLARARLEWCDMLDEWQAALADAGTLDYPSMLERATQLLSLPSVRRQIGRLYAHVVVDEAQNLTPAQYEFFLKLIGPTDQHIPSMMVGDDKQSIVSFAGADPTLMKRFEREYNAQQFVLRHNFRSARRIAALGHAVAACLGTDGSSEPVPKQYAAPGKVEFLEAPDEAAEGRAVARWALELIAQGLPPDATARDESRSVNPEDIAVLARSAASLYESRKAFEAAGHSPATASSPEDWLLTTAGKVAYELIALRSAVDHRSTHWHLARLLGTSEDAIEDGSRLGLLLSNHPDPLIAALQPLAVVSAPEKYMDVLNELTLPAAVRAAEVADFDADCHQLRDSWQTFLSRTERNEQTWGNFRLFITRIQSGSELSSGVRLLTVHRAQGREYRAVAIVGLNDGQFPDFRAKDRDDQLAELRTFYVAATRPRRVLLLSRAALRRTRYGSRVTDPSPYLDLARTAIAGK